ncbi:MAG: hypothetical protein NTX61_06580 [Bacteroidetes bacterium]|nr:hypothetical protein [Bacteroidota bacterium]
MARDFTVSTYRKILQSLLDAEYIFLTYADYQASSANIRCVILRHDVDADPEKSLEFAKIEKSINIRSTFYFKTSGNSFNEQIIKEIAGLGHEIGYHYMDLYESNGNISNAIRSFEINLSFLRQFYPVHTICMDGRSLSKWNNLELWKSYDYKQFGITGEPYLDINFNLVLYLTDTGRKWNTSRFNLYDKVQSAYNYNNKSSKEIIRDVANNTLPDQIMITTHPQRWHDKIIPWINEFLQQILKNSLKLLIIKFRSWQNR